MGFEIEVAILLSNLMMTAVLTLATLYRIKLEKRQVDAIAGNVEAMERIKAIKRVLATEKDMLKCMTPEEFIDFLEKVVSNEN
jgi:tryptophan 2,3-dioxygenase